MWESVKEWTHTLLSGLPLWELESWWTPRFLESNLEGRNSFDWRLPYTIRNFLKCRCLKWGHIIYFSIKNIGYGQKKDWELKCQFDSQPLKVRNCPYLHVCKGRATYCWKSLNKGCNFSLNYISIWSFHKKLWVSKVVGILISSPRKNAIWV
jgi:hypothetical protein